MTIPNPRIEPTSSLQSPRIVSPNEDHGLWPSILISPFFHSRPFRSRNGYTIVEICLVLLIMALLVGAAIPLASSIYEEDQMREPMRQIQLLARTARHLSTTQQKTYVVTISHDFIRLHRQDSDTATDTSSDSSSPSGSVVPPPISTDTTNPDEETAQPSQLDPVELEYPLPTDVKITVRGWQETDWYEPENRDWVFPPTGLCEPLEIHIQKGDNYIEQSFDPLTGSVKDEKYKIQ